MDESEQIEDDLITFPNVGPNFFRIGFWMTLTYLALVIGFSLWDRVDVALMKPNEWGDFLAGLFGPLALLWVVLGFLQQGSELRNSRDALLLQARELRHSVNAQKALVDVSREQVAAERDLLTAQESARLLANRPMLMLSLGAGSRSGVRFKQTFTLKNLAKTCSSISLNADFGGENIVSRKLEELGADKKLEFTLEVPCDLEIPETEVLVSFVDANGHEGCRIFKVSKTGVQFEIGSAYGTDPTA